MAWFDAREVWLGAKDCCLDVEKTWIGTGNVCLGARDVKLCTEDACFCPGAVCLFLGSGEGGSVEIIWISCAILYYLLFSVWW